MKTKYLLIAFLASAPSGIMAAGYYLPNQDAFVTARVPTSLQH